jgi:hypothetical protein
MPATHLQVEGADELLSLIRGRYMNSPDFNGFHIHGPEVTHQRKPAVELVRMGLVQVVSNQDYPNIHIRPWASKRSMEDQVQDLKSLRARDYGICLYPTQAGMKGVRLPRRFADRPFARAMAMGKGTLELAYFSVEVLEQYRNDARYLFAFGDFGAAMTLSDEAFEDPTEPEMDSVFLNHIGFAYDISDYDQNVPDSPVVRRVTVFHCDLVTLTPGHQQRWKTYLVPDQGLEPHPAWWNSQMGKWQDGVGPFERLFLELKTINKLTMKAFGAELFASVDRPGELGWLLRPSQREWDEFVSQLDKLLSENLQHSFFSRVGIARQDPQGQMFGSLNRLLLFMERHGVSKERAQVVLKPLREVRHARQAPAHSIRKNTANRSFVHRQISLVHETNQALIGLRDWLSTHPKNASWSDPYNGLIDHEM